MKKCVILFSIVLTSFVFIDDRFDIIFNNLEVYSGEASPDKIYVHTDRAMYALEDTIWLKTYLVDGVTHLQNTFSKVVHIELQNTDGQVVKNHKVYIGDKGAASDIIIDREWKTGTYSLRAYTRHMLNQDPEYIFNKRIEILDITKAYEDIFTPTEQVEEVVDFGSENSVDISFFPESGELVAGIDCKVAIKIDGDDYEGRTGTIQDNNGETIAPFKIYKFGLGTASFTPVAGEKYVAQIDGEPNVYPLSTVKAKGYNLSTTQKREAVTLQLKTNIESGLSGGKILGHQRGALLLSHDIPDNAGQDYTFKLATESVNSGVVTFTFFDKDVVPHCERLVFVNNSEVSSEIKLDKTVYGKRDKSQIEFRINSESSDIKYDCSVSIVDRNNIESVSTQGNIKTWLLLNSDLRGEIDNPTYFFEEFGDYKRAYLLDLVMMINGWRRFSWEEMNAEDAYTQLEYEREVGLYVNGTTTKMLWSNSPLKSNVTLTFLNSGFNEDNTVTTEDGQFSFGPYIVYDTVNAILQARRYKNDDQGKLEGKRNLNINLENSPRVDLPNIIAKDLKDQDSESAYSEYVSGSRTSQALKDQYHSMEVMLDEIVLTEKRETEEGRLDDIQKRLSPYRDPDNRMILKDNDRVSARTVFDLIRTIPGVSVSGTSPNQSATIRGISSINASTKPLYILDGMPIDEGFVGTMNVNNIIFIDVLKGPKAAIYGSRGGNGVVAIYTGNTGSNSVRSRKPGILDITISGFAIGREFYSPDYSKDVSEVYTPDVRTTLYWNPMVDIDGSASTSVDFFTGDNAGSYEILIEGIGTDGSIVCSTHELIIQ